nr:hypothetical protein [Tanacetum cinerariifolium]
DVKTVKTIDVNQKGVFSTEEPKPVMKNNFSPPIIEDWHSYDESEVEISPTVEVKIVKPSVEKIKSIKTARETVKNKESPKQHKHHSRGNQRNWNNLMSQRLGMWNNTRRVNHKNFSNKFTHPHPKRGFVPQIVLTRSGKINTVGASDTTADRLVNNAGSKSTVNHPRLISKAFKRGHSQDTRPYNKFSANKSSIFNKMVNTVKVNDSTARDRAVLSENMRREVYDVNASGCWVWRPKKNVIDHVSKQNSASLTLKRFVYIDVQGREDRLKLKELMKLSTTLFDRVLDLEKTKTTQAKEIANLK